MLKLFGGFYKKQGLKFLLYLNCAGTHVSSMIINADLVYYS